jgi:hypothetical protein
MQAVGGENKNKSSLFVLTLTAYAKYNAFCILNKLDLSTIHTDPNVTPSPIHQITGKPAMKKHTLQI